MKLVIVIVNDDDCSRLLDETTQAGFSATRLATTGGFLRAGNSTLLFGVENEKVDDVIEIIRRCCSKRQQLVHTNPTFSAEFMMSVPVEVTVGGATIFVLDIDRFLKL